jgi:hypothetical protein
MKKKLYYRYNNDITFITLHFCSGVIVLSSYIELYIKIFELDLYKNCFNNTCSYNSS